MEKYTLETKYAPGTGVYIVVGSDDKAKVILSKISAINICAAISGVKTTYSCTVNREEIGTVVVGMPLEYTVEKTEDKMFETLQECLDNIVAEAARKEKHKAK